MSIPILDQSGRVVGWTDDAPQVLNGRLLHREATALLKSNLTATYVQLDQPEQAQRAGAPQNWPEPWRCLAICPASFGEPIDAGPVLSFPEPKVLGR